MPQNRENYEMSKNAIFYEIERISHLFEKMQKVTKELNNALRYLISYSIEYNIPEKQNCENRENRKKLEKLNNEQKCDFRKKVEKHIKLIKQNLSVMEAERIESETSVNSAIVTYAKLLEMGYTETLIYQAIQDASNDSFWSKQFRSYPKLLRKNKDGVFYIDVFLALKQRQHKLSIPRIIR